MTSFSYDRVWQDLMAMLRANAGVLAVLAGVFFFLPALILFLAAPLPNTDGQTGTAAFEVVLDYYRGNIGWFILVSAVAMFGQIAIMVLLIDRSRPTVAEALAGGARLFPGYFVTQFAVNLSVLFGAFFLLLPGLYLAARFFVVGGVMADRRSANPAEGLSGGWAVTNGRGWAVLGLVLLVGIVGWIAFGAGSSVLTLLLALLVPESLRPLTGALVDSASGAMLSLLLVLLSAAIYRQLTANRDVARVFD